MIYLTGKGIYKSRVVEFWNISQQSNRLHLIISFVLRVKVYERLKRYNLQTPRYAVLNRDRNLSSKGGGETCMPLQFVTFNL